MSVINHLPSRSVGGSKVWGALIFLNEDDWLFTHASLGGPEPNLLGALTSSCVPSARSQSYNMAPSPLCLLHLVFFAFCFIMCICLLTYIFSISTPFLERPLYHFLFQNTNTNIVHITEIKHSASLKKIHMTIFVEDFNFVMTDRRIDKKNNDS